MQAAQAATQDVVELIVPDFVCISDDTERQTAEFREKFNTFFSNNPGAADKVNFIYFGVRSKGIDMETKQDRYELYFEVHFNEPYFYGKHGHKMKDEIEFKLKREVDMFRTLLAYPERVGREPCEILEKVM